MEKTLDLKMPGLNEQEREELLEINGGGILGRSLGSLIGSLIQQVTIAGNYYYQDGNYTYSPLR